MRSFLFIVFCLFLPIAYKEVTKGFRLDKVAFELPFHSDWEIAPLSPAQQHEMQTVLGQPFSYLSQGSQTFVFQSQDSKYVLKIFRSDLLKGRKRRWLRKWYRMYIGRPSKKTASFHEKVLKTFHACRIAYEKAPDLTGVLYVHLNAGTALFLPPVTIKDRIGRSYLLPTDSYRFVVQKKAQPFRKALLQTDNAQELSEKLESFLVLLKERSLRGIVNTDPNIGPNFGFIGNKAVEIDFGNYSDQSDKIAQSNDFFRFANRLRPWLHRNKPESVADFDQKIQLLSKCP